MAACVWIIPGSANAARQHFAVPGQQVQPFAVQRPRLRVAGVVGGHLVQRAVAVERRTREHPLQVDRVVLGREVEQVAEAGAARWRSALRSVRIGARALQPAQQLLRVDQRPLDVVDRGGVDVAAGVQPVGLAEARRVAPGEELLRLCEREARVRVGVQQRRQQGPGGERLTGLVGVVGVPPDAAAVRVPPDPRRCSAARVRRRSGSAACRSLGRRSRTRSPHQPLSSNHVSVSASRSPG